MLEGTGKAGEGDGGSGRGRWGSWLSQIGRNE